MVVDPLGTKGNNTGAVNCYILKTCGRNPHLALCITKKQNKMLTRFWLRYSIGIFVTNLTIKKDLNFDDINHPQFTFCS